MRIKRQGLIVWYQHRKHIRHIKRYGNLIYISKKMRFAVLYVNQEDVEKIENELLKLPFISKVDRSHKPFIDTNFENAKPDQAKLYDYK